MININITPPDRATYKKIQSHWDSLSKPIDGLGDFEKLICRIGAIQGRETPQVSDRTAVVFCADNGVVEEGVSQCGQEVTAKVAQALGAGTSTLNHMAKAAGVRVLPVDIGIAGSEEYPGVRNMKVAPGTRNFLKEPAMDEAQALLAIEHGMTLAKELADAGCNLLAAGEMGIGNTTTATALLCALLKQEPEKLCGRGAGLDNAGLDKKRSVIAAGLQKYEDVNALPEPERALALLCRMGGFDIAGMAGLYIGGAVQGVPVVCDGVISTTAALLAQRMVPGVKDYVIPSHAGREEGNLFALRALSLEPLIAGNMALGEATGAVMIFPLIDTVMNLYMNGTRFTEADITPYERFDEK